MIIHPIIYTQQVLINNIYYICIGVKMYAILYPTDENVVTNDNPSYNIHTTTGMSFVLGLKMY